MKKVKKILRTIARVTLSVGAVTGMVLLFAAGVQKTANMPCTAVSISIDHSTGNFFINEEDLLPMVYQYGGEAVIGKPVNEINFRSMEESIQKKSFVKDVEVYSDIKGEIFVNVLQKRPLMRIINNDAVSYYLDESGEKMPLSSNFTARVPIATGEIGKYTDEADSTLTNALFELAKFLDGDRFWQAQVSQVYVRKDGSMELIPRLGNHTILLGSADDLKEKFDRLMIFYKEGLKNVGWDKYKAIDVRYNGQIVARKY